MENNFEKQMENLETPKTEFVKHQEILKIGMVNAKKSARIGILFILAPILILLLAFVKIKLLIGFDFFVKFEKMFTTTGENGLPGYLPFILFVVLPLIAFFINLLAVSHFYINKTTRELIITIKYRLRNVIVLIVSTIIIATFFVYFIFFY
ncbi:MAG TPA: hypothetical protein PK252_06995 [Bacteroidales bacterium]|nr:hypothetical protein [Bacteroidales bacterium]